MFFSRIQTIYGKGRCKTLFEDDAELAIMRREWAKTLGQFAMEQLETIMTRLKGKLAEGDPDYRFPDIARILALTNEPKRDPSHKTFPRGLPEPEWRKQERLERGRIASKTCMAVMSGSACFLEDKPSDSTNTAATE